MTYLVSTKNCSKLNTKFPLKSFIFKRNCVMLEPRKNLTGDNFRNKIFIAANKGFNKKGKTYDSGKGSDY